MHHLFYTGLSLELVGIGAIVLRRRNNFPDATFLSDPVQWKFVL